MRGSWGTDFLGYLPARESSRVLGLYIVSGQHFSQHSGYIPVEGSALPDGSLLVRIRLSSR